MRILGINAYHGDSAACLVVDGRLAAAAEEERFRRIKHWAGLPSEAIRYCLNATGIVLADVDHIAINRDSGANFLRKAFYALSRRPRLDAVMNRSKNALHIQDIRGAIAEKMGTDQGSVRASVHRVEHHRAHLASAFLVSPFETAAVVSVDGFGDFVSTMWGAGKGSEIRILSQVIFPHSLGLFYLSMPQFLGFKQYGDEYKVMGLAAYGKPVYL